MQHLILVHSTCWIVQKKNKHKYDFIGVDLGQKFTELLLSIFQEAQKPIWCRDILWWLNLHANAAIAQARAAAKIEQAKTGEFSQPLVSNVSTRSSITGASVAKFIDKNLWFFNWKWNIRYQYYFTDKCVPFVTSQLMYFSVWIIYLGRLTRP